MKRANQPPRNDGTTDPLVSVIVPHFDDLERLSLCLDALAAQHGLARQPEIVVADNGSPQGEAALLAVIDGRARLVHAAERGAGPARNIGVAASNGTILAFTDADCIPDADWLTSGIRALARADLVGGRMMVLVDHKGSKTPAEAFETVFAFDNASYVARKGFSVTANLFTRRDVFDAVGGFRIGMSEDLDWCHRARLLGYRLAYAADAAVGHPARADWHQLRRKWLRIQAETYALTRPTMAHRMASLAKAWAMPLSIIADMPRIWKSPALVDRGERWAALRGLVRLRLWRMVDAHRLVLGLRR